MRYLFVAWLHNLPDEPSELISEIDEQSWEVRKVEIFRDGTCGYAEEGDSTEGTRLSEIPIPALEEINASTEFFGKEIAHSEFEQAWAAAHQLAHRT